MNFLTIALLGSFIVTSYQSIPEQTDNSPCEVSTGHKISPTGIAVHPTLLCPRAKYTMGNKIKLCKRENQCSWRDRIHYYDLVYVESIGPKFVNDVMAWKPKMNSYWDVWVPTLQAEKLHHLTYKHKELKVWLLSKVK